MKALITGAGGQVARALAAGAAPGWRVTSLSRAELDIADEARVRRVAEALDPDVIVNAAACTAVDRAEAEPERAFRVNRDGAANLARAASSIGARLIHISTDFVFDGCSKTAYRPDDRPAPLNVYGASKLAGEAAVVASGAHSLIVRTAWVYSPHGNNFLTTMLRLMNSRPEVRVVDDQVGSPTSAASLAAGLWALIEADARGVLHYADAGRASWCDFARAIAEEGRALGLAPAETRVVPIATKDHPTVARRPAFSVLDTTATSKILGRDAPQWRVGLREQLAALKGATDGNPWLSGDLE